MVGESQEPVEGKHHLELLRSSAGADTDVSGGFGVQKGILRGSIVIFKYRHLFCFQLYICLSMHTSQAHQDLSPCTHLILAQVVGNHPGDHSTLPFIHSLVVLCLGCPS